MKITTLQSWQELLHRHETLNKTEWAHWEQLTDEFLDSTAFKKMQPARQEQFQQLWARRRTLQPQDAQQLDRWFRTLKQDIQLQPLWSRRDTLTDPEWHRLYQLIYQILQANTPETLLSLPEDLAVYIHDFFTRKVLEPCYREGFQANSQIHAGAICVYFERFLLDRRREIRTPETRKEEMDIAEVIESIGQDPRWKEMTEPSSDMLTALNELGLTIEKVNEAAQTFIDRLEPSDRLLLKCSFCTSDEQHTPVSRLTGVIPTPAYHARRLGITRGGNQFPDYRATILGRWLTSSRVGLGLALNNENREALSAALKILCWHSLIDKEMDCKRVSGQSSKERDRAP